MTACCVIKMRDNSLSGSVNLFKGVNVIDIPTKVSKFSQVRVIEGQFVPREPELVLVIGSFEKSGMKLYSLIEANPRETRFASRYRKVREAEGSRNRDSTVRPAPELCLPGGVTLSYLGYVGTCCWTGYGFLASKVLNRVYNLTWLCPKEGQNLS